MKGNRECQGLVWVAVMNRTTGQAMLEKGYLSQDWKEGREQLCGYLREEVSKERKQQVPRNEASERVASPRKSKADCLAEVEGSSGREVGDKIGEVMDGPNHTGRECHCKVFMLNKVGSHYKVLERELTD